MASKFVISGFLAALTISYLAGASGLVDVVDPITYYYLHHPYAKISHYKVSHVPELGHSIITSDYKVHHPVPYHYFHRPAVSLIPNPTKIYRTVNLDNYVRSTTTEQCNNIVKTYHNKWVVWLNNTNEQLLCTVPILPSINVGLSQKCNFRIVGVKLPARQENRKIIKVIRARNNANVKNEAVPIGLRKFPMPRVPTVPLEENEEVNEEVNEEQDYQEEPEKDNYEPDSHHHHPEEGYEPQEVEDYANENQELPEYDEQDVETENDYQNDDQGWEEQPRPRNKRDLRRPRIVQHSKYTYFHVPVTPTRSVVVLQKGQIDPEVYAACERISLPGALATSNRGVPLCVSDQELY